MNSKILLAIAAILIIGAGVYFVAGSKSSKTTWESIDTPTKTVTSESKTMSFKDFLTTGTSQKCTFSSSADNTSTAGTIFTTKGKVRGDITTTTAGKTTISHMIFNQTSMYVWVDGQKQGFTTKIDAKTMEQAQSDAQNMQMNVNQKYDYTCSPSAVNGAIFTVPANVDFMDFSKMMPKVSVTGSASGAADMKAIQCATCKNMKGDDQTKCMSIFSCN